MSKGNKMGITNGPACPPPTVVPFAEERVAHIQSLIDNGISQLVPKNGLVKKTYSGHPTVLLTGSTGALGGHILAVLLNDNRIHHVYTLNRSGSSTIDERQAETFRKLSLDEALLGSTKLTSLQGDLMEQNLGLAPTVYEELLNSVSVIIHNAWPIQFRSPLHKFEPFIAGSINLINLARRSRSSSLRFLFTSSIMSVQNFGFETRVPDTVIMDPRVCLGTGYGESKYVIQRILSASHVNGCTVRIPQLYGGGTDGIWPASNWLPVMIQSSIALGQAPLMSGLLDWLPMSIVAKALLDISIHDGELPLSINISHPKPVIFNNALTWIRALLSVHKGGQASPLLPVIPLELWAAKVQSLSNGGTFPRFALGIASFLGELAEREKYRLETWAVGPLPLLDSGFAHRISPSLGQLEQVDKAVVQGWVEYWVKEGYLTLNGRGLSRL